MLVVQQKLNQTIQDYFSGVRDLCPTRPSPIVVRRLTLARQEEDTRNSEKALKTSLFTTVNMSGEGNGEKGVAEETKSKSQKLDGGMKERIKKKTTAMDAEGVTGEGEARVGGSASSALWLFSSLPFYDDESFRVFFCEVLLSSKRLAQRFR